MMKRVMISCLILFMCYLVNAQKKCNFIIVIDEQLLVGSSTKFRIISRTNTGQEKIFNIDYYPGKLIIQDSVYEKILDSSVIANTLTFTLFDGLQSMKTVEYSVDFKSGWLDHYYFILRIYDLGKKKYRKRFDLTNEKKFAIEIDYPGGSTRLIRKG